MPETADGCWPTLPLGQLFRLHRESINPGSRPREVFEHFSIPAFDETGGPLEEPGRAIESNKTLLPDATILVSKLNPRKPRVLLVKGESSRTRCASTEWMPYVPLGQEVDLHFFSWLLGSERFQRRLERVATGSTNSHVRVRPTETLRWAVPLPSVREQRRIAEILNTINAAIRKTEQVIAKLQQTKHGLLHDLLTRGIDKNGELRDPELHPEQFKDSPLGRLPKRWEVRRVEQLLAAVDPAMRSGPFGSALLKHELVATGVPLLGIDNVHVELFVAEFSRFVSPQKAAELSRYRVRPRDVMITIMGTVGRCAVVPDDIGAALSSKHVWTLTFDQALYSPYLVCLQFNHAPWVRRHFDRDEQGGIMSAIRSETLRTALLPVPPREEQHLIETALTDLERRIREEHWTAPKLRALKQGLMDDLLTGRVRVAVPEEAA